LKGLQHGTLVVQPAENQFTRRGGLHVKRGSGAREIMPSLNKQLRNLQVQRGEIAGNMAALFQ